MSFDLARKIADAVLYEGYILYPYRASSAKNQFRWQFGVVAPRAWTESAGGDPCEMQTECLIEPEGVPLVDVTVRFLQAQTRKSDGAVPWDEGIERAVELRSLPLDALTRTGLDTPFAMPPLSGIVRISAERMQYFVKLRIRIENLTEFPNASTSDRNAAMRHSLAGVHTLLSVTSGEFVSLTDPPREAVPASAACHNLHTWPVLVGAEGSRDVMLSSPIILPDYPAIAKESQGDFFDGAEIDEILTLRVMTLTDEEKREAEATDDRARAIIERCESIPPEIFERLHGAIRSLTPLAATEAFFNPPEEEPEKASIQIGNRTVSKGERVRIAPTRQADSMDLFLAGRIGKVHSVHHDLDDRVYVAVTVEDDPAAEMYGSHSRYFYFAPDELELLEQKES